jgi:peptide/nickel transport system permease protein
MAALDTVAAAPTVRAPRPAGIALPATLLGLVAVFCFLLPVIGSLPSPTGGDVLAAGLPPLTNEHILGTDLNGNDVLSRLAFGGRSSLMIALLANLAGLVIGATLGAISAEAGGAIDAVLMRVLDAFIAFPSLVLVLVIAQALDASVPGTIVALACFTIPAFARVSRAATLRLREQAFMLAAALSDTPAWRTLTFHVGPNIVPQLTSFLFLGIGISIVVEGALSYLGLGVPPPAPSWGNMIFHGQQAMQSQPSLILLPSLCIFATVLACNLLADALRRRWTSQ